MRVPLAVPDLTGRESEYLQECVESTFVSTAGPFVSRFEDEVAKISGTSSAAAVCSGTVALQLALEAVDVRRGDLVMLPSLTFIASPNSVRHAGADVWLTDCTPDAWTMDLDLVHATIEAETVPHPRGRLHEPSGKVLRAVMPVMTMGATLDFDRVGQIAAQFGLKVVVDAAAAIGATTFEGAALGTAPVDVVCYSFNGNKTITTGGGGAVASSDDVLVANVRHVSTTARVGSAYEHDVVGYNFRMTNVEAAIGVAQLERLGSFIARKRHVHETYVDLASRLPDVLGFPDLHPGRGTHWFTGLFWNGDDPDVPERFRSFMVERGVDVRPFWLPVHRQPPYKGDLRTTVDVSERLWDRIIPLPCSSGISDDELSYVVSVAEEFWIAHGRGAGG